MKIETLKYVSFGVLLAFAAIALYLVAPVLLDVGDQFAREYERACEGSSMNCTEEPPSCPSMARNLPGPGWLWCPIPIGLIGLILGWLVVVGAFLKWGVELPEVDDNGEGGSGSS